MRRTGEVFAINPMRGMIAIATPDDGFTIIEMLSEWDVEVGDLMAWNNGYGMGSEKYENTSKGTEEEVYVQNHSVHQSTLRSQLRL